MLVLICRIRLIFNRSIIRLNLNFIIMRVDTRYKKSLTIFLDVVHAFTAFFALLRAFVCVDIVLRGARSCLRLGNLWRTRKMVAVALWRKLVGSGLGIGNFSVRH